MMRGCLVAVFLLELISRAEAFDDGKTCYVLDGILVIYGIVLTFLYCRLRMQPVHVHHTVYPEKQAYEGGIYAGLTPHSTDTYETIKFEKKSIV